MKDSIQSSQEAIQEARKALRQHPNPPHDPALAFEMLDLLAELAVASPIEVSIQGYSYGSKLLQDGTWFRKDGTPYPPGTAFLGIVLDKVLEVSVVEDLKEPRLYHRPMAMLYPGGLFGLFELADFQCGALSRQSYSVFAGARTFFFTDKNLDGGGSPQVGGALTVLTKNESAFNLGSAAIYKEKAEGRGYSSLIERYSPTQIPHLVFQAVVGKSTDWETPVLLVAISSSLLEKLVGGVRERLVVAAWKQGAHLMRAAIDNYNSDRVEEQINLANNTMKSDVAREMQALFSVLADQRPGFLSLGAPEYEQYGPFNSFFTKLSAYQEKARKSEIVHSHLRAFAKMSFNHGVYVPANRFDRSDGDLIIPVFPNCHPSWDGKADMVKAAGSTPFNKHRKEWLPSDQEPYIAEITHWSGEKANDENNKKITILRTCASVSPRPARLPAFQQVIGGLAGIAGVIAVQHLMEETVCLVSELITQRQVKAGSIWILGKPYSSNYRVAHRLRSLGVRVLLPVPKDDCNAGEFDIWFSREVGEFFKNAVEDLTPADGAKAVIVLLDDGGALIRAAGGSNPQEKMEFVAVEQTSRGLEAAISAAKKFRVVPVACCALKSIVEPEFVARAAVAKLAKAYPEALRAEKVGIVGLGNIGRYLCDYLIRRPDVSVKSVFAYDRVASRRNGLPDGVQCVDSVAKLLGNSGVKVLLCCTGTDLSDELEKSKPSESVLCISLSSGDVEFSGLLRKAGSSSRYGLARCGNFLIAAGGFPVTFDREPLSAPVFEMQITRALLLAGMIEAAAATEAKGLVKLSADAQWNIWSQWRAEASDATTPNAEIRRWQQQRISEKLPDLGDLIPTAGDLEKENDRLFQERTTPNNPPPPEPRARARDHES